MSKVTLQEFPNNLSMKEMEAAARHLSRIPVSSCESNNEATGIFKLLNNLNYFIQSEKNETEGGEA